MRTLLTQPRRGTSTPLSSSQSFIQLHHRIIVANNPPLPNEPIGATHYPPPSKNPPLPPPPNNLSADLSAEALAKVEALAKEEPNSQSLTTKQTQSTNQKPRIPHYQTNPIPTSNPSYSPLRNEPNPKKVAKSNRSHPHYQTKPISLLHPNKIHPPPCREYICQEHQITV